jgi:hypothetical protein
MLGLGASALAALATLSAVPGEPPSTGALVLELRGRVVCVSAPAEVRPCGEETNRFALQPAEGSLRLFSVSDILSRMFEDERVRERELVVRARPTPEGLETIKVYSIHDGKLCDLDYFCEVCNIVAYAPGPCPCCRRPLVLRERPMPGTPRDSEASTDE